MLEADIAVGKSTCGYVHKLSDLLYTACSVDMLILCVTLWISLIRSVWSRKKRDKEQRSESRSKVKVGRSKISVVRALLNR